MPPKNNASNRALSALKNGSRISRLALGELPKSMFRVTRYAREYRRTLEDAVCAVHGNEVDLTRAHLIDAACTHEQHAQVCRWLLRERLDKMSTADIRECSKQIASSKDARNRAVEQLQLDPDHEHEITALYTQHIERQSNAQDES